MTAKKKATMLTWRRVSFIFSSNICVAIVNLYKIYNLLLIFFFEGKKHFDEDTVCILRQ